MVKLAAITTCDTANVQLNKTLLLSSLMFTFSRTLSIYFIEARDPLKLAATGVFSMIICAVGDSFAYTMRWVLVRSFVF